MKIFRDEQPKLFEAFIKSAQYLVRLQKQQDIWDHVGKFLITYLPADWTAFIRRDAARQISLHRCSLPEGMAQGILTEEVRGIVSEVLDSGFLASQILLAPAPSMTAFLPVVESGKPDMAMLVGHSSADALSNELLDIYLALAGLAGSTSERLKTEMELNRHRTHLEDLVRARTAELEQAQRHNELILNSVGEGICGLDLEGNLTFINPAAARLTGWEPDDLIGRNAHAAFHHTRPTGRPYPAVECPIHAAIGKENRTYITSEQFVRKDGTLFPVEFMTTSILEADQAVGAVLVFRDITERKQAEEALRASEQRWAITLASIGDAVIATDTDGRVTFLNEVAEALTGWRMADAAGKPVQEVFHITNEHTRATVENPVRKVLQSGMIAGLANHTVLLRKGGGEVPIDDSGAPIRDETGRIVGVVLVFRDIRERRQAEQRLRESEQRVRRKLESVLSPEGDLGLLELADLIDMPALQNLMDDFYAVAGITMSIRDTKGQELVGVGWQDICTQFHRVQPETCRHCQESDIRLSSGLAKGEYRLFKCGNNMWDMATPIIVAGQHVGNIFTGQFFFENETVDRELFRVQARQYGFDEQRYLAALDRVPRLSRETVNRGIAFFLKLSDTISQLGYSNVKLARLLSERDRLTDSLRESQAKLRAALASMTDAVFISDGQGRIIDFNDAFATFHRFRNQDEYARTDAAYPGFLDMLMADGEPAPPDHWTVPRALRGETATNAEYCLRRKDTGETWVGSYSFGPIRDNEGMIVGSVVVGRDITERKRAEEALQTNKERLELLATVAERLLRSEDPQAIVEELCRLVMAHLDCQFFFNYLVEVPGRRMYLNASAGISGEAADAIRRLDFGVAVCGCVARDGERIVAENIQLGDDRRTQLVKSFGVQAYCCHPLLAQDRLIGTLSFGTTTRPTFTADEVTLMKSVSDQVSVAMQRLQAEKALHSLNASLFQQVAERTALAEAKAKQLQALAVELIEAEERERRQFADLLHDDLQQMLAAAKMQLQAVSATLPHEPMLQHVNQILEESIAKSRRLSHELSPAVLHHSSLFEVLQWLSRQMSDQFGLQVELEADGEHPFEYAPLKRFLFRAVKELLFNIVKHAGAKSARVLLTGTDSSLVITVSDQGLGFDPGTIDSSIEKAGFGLLSIRERASYIGGNLAIDSAPGKGSRFTLAVPLGFGPTDDRQPIEPCPEQRACKTSSRGKKHAKAGMRVLFADDHQVMRQGLIQLIASQPDIQVVGEAANGREALEQARRIRPDVIVMDISMPEMDGIEATRHIKSEMPEVRVIGLSMHDDEHLAETMRKAGAEAFVSKTVSSAELLKAIYGIAREN
jgi:PAS domain S-box-containing protein